MQTHKQLFFYFSVVSNMAEDAEAAMAAAELDGNRPRKINPLTIIQVTKSLIIYLGKGITIIQEIWSN